MLFLFFGIVSCAHISQQTHGAIGAVKEDYTIHDCLFTNITSSVIQYTSSGGHTLTMILVYAQHITSTKGALCYITSNIKLEHHFIALAACTTTDSGIIYSGANSCEESTFDYYSARTFQGKLFRFHIYELQWKTFHFKNSNYSESNQSPADYMIYFCHVKTNFKYCHITCVSNLFSQLLIEQSKRCYTGSGSSCQIHDGGLMEYCYFANNQLLGNWKGVICVYGTQFKIKNSVFQNNQYYPCYVMFGILTIQDCCLDKMSYSSDYHTDYIHSITITGNIYPGNEQTKFKMTFFATGGVHAEIKYPTRSATLNLTRSQTPKRAINTLPRIKPGHFPFFKRSKILYK